MLNKQETMQLLNEFSEDCYKFWLREGKSEKEARIIALEEASTLKYDPFSPCGEEIDQAAKEEFITKERKALGL